MTSNAGSHRETEINERASLVTVRAGPAGYNLARRWCELDGETPLLMITVGDGRPYSRPMLPTSPSRSKDIGGLVMVEPGATAEQLNMCILTYTRITGVDPGHQRIWIGKEEVCYHDPVLAWGTKPTRVPIEDDVQDTLCLINDLEDYACFYQAATGKCRVPLFGAGLIGYGLANDLSNGGCQPDVMASRGRVMPGLLHPATAKAVQAGLEGLGIRSYLGPMLANLKRAGEGLEAHLSDGEVIPCDLAVSVVGPCPRTELTFATELVVSRGIIVDHSLYTSHTNIYTLGDCAEVDDLDLLYVISLMACARALTQTLAGNPSQVAYDPMPVTVKTPAYPLVVSPPSRRVDGRWLVEGSRTDLKILCRDTAGRVTGYILIGAAVNEKLALNRKLPGLMT